MTKSNIKVTENNFSLAIDPQVCLIWAEKFLKNELSLEEEIEETLGTIDNEDLWATGSNTKEQEKMHLDNARNLYVYLSWLKDIEAELK